jgi:two-component system, OmpR family, response regulator
VQKPAIPAKPSILAVDDDEHIAELIKLYLLKENYEVTMAYDGKDALKKFQDGNFQLVLLDIMLPYLDGWEVVKEIRKTSDVPVIMLTAKGESFDKVLGLELGADDYIVKPFDPKELLARIKAVLRRYEPKEEQQERLSFPNLDIDMERYIVTVNNEELELPPKELELLHFLARRPNKVFTREQLIEQVWGYDYLGDSRTIDVHVKRLRQKIERPGQTWEIKTVWGVGYKFEIKE